MFKRILKALGLSKQEDKDPEGFYDRLQQSMEEFKNRPIYKELSLEIIDNTPDQNLLQLIFDNLLEKMPADYDNEYETVMNWNESRQAIYWIWTLEAEVNNGGFNQFYYNSGGQYYGFIPAALRLIGANQFAELVQQANDTYERENDKITAQLDGTLEGFSKSYQDNPLNQFDDLFYELSDKENLQQKQIAYIRTHKQHFVDR